MKVTEKVMGYNRCSVGGVEWGEGGKGGGGGEGRREMNTEAWLIMSL